MTTERNAAISVVAELQRHGHIAAFAGGCVRDELLGLTPNDYDVATSALPDEVERLFTRTISNGKSRGVIKVLMGGEIIDVATLRADGQYSDGRRPDTVEFVTSLEQDAARRDFTINAMFQDPFTGEIFDFFGGREDLEQGIIRSVGNAFERISEDRLRMLRAVRFASRYGFAIEAELLAAIKASAHTLLAGMPVSFERITSELEGILTSTRPAVGLDLLMEIGLMKEIIPELVECNTHRGDQDPIWHPEGNTWLHSLMVVEQLAGSSFELMLGALLHDVGKPDTQECWTDDDGVERISNEGHAEVGAVIADGICRRLKLSNASRLRVTEMVRLHMLMHVVPELRPGKLAALLAREDIHDLIALQHADAVGNGRENGIENSHTRFLLARLEEIKQQPEKPLVTGRTLIGLGFEPGPVFGEMLAEALSAQRQGAFASATEALAWAKDRFSGDGQEALACA